MDGSMGRSSEYKEEEWEEGAEEQQTSVFPVFFFL